MEKQSEKTAEKEKLSGEELLQEYFEQDTDDKHFMGYSVYTRTEGDGCCC